MCNCSHVDDLLLHFLSTRYLWRDFVCTCICIKQLIFVLLYFLHGGILLMARYMVLKHPHLGLRLRLFKIYTKKELERRCGNSLQILATLQIFLTDRFFSEAACFPEAACKTQPHPDTEVAGRQDWMWEFFLEDTAVEGSQGWIWQVFLKRLLDDIIITVFFLRQWWFVFIALLHPSFD